MEELSVASFSPEIASKRFPVPKWSGVDDACAEFAMVEEVVEDEGDTVLFYFVFLFFFPLCVFFDICYSFVCF